VARRGKGQLEAKKEEKNESRHVAGAKTPKKLRVGRGKGPKKKKAPTRQKKKQPKGNKKKKNETQRKKKTAVETKGHCQVMGIAV